MNDRYPIRQPDLPDLMRPPRLRTGRKVSRTLYEQLGPEPSDADPVVGLVDTPELAAEIAAAVNTARSA